MFRIIKFLFCVLVVLAVTSIQLPAQTVAWQWSELEGQLAEAPDSTTRLELQLALDLTYVYQSEEKTGVATVPPSLSRFDSLFNSVTAWKHFCGTVLIDLYQERKSPVHALDNRLINHFIASAGSLITTGVHKEVDLADLFANNAIARSLMETIIHSLDRTASAKAAVLLTAIRNNKTLYERKYQRGYRNRNILQYYLDSGFHHFFLKERKGLLSPPSSGELILLSKPSAVVGSNSLENDTFSDKNNFYIMAQMIGWDFFIRGFKAYWGLSLFSSVPVANDAFENTFWGVEAHYSNKVLVGYGIRKDRDETDAKVFVTVPVFLSALPGF